MSDPSSSNPSQAQRLREQERARIARDLHDELGGQLTGIGMALGQLREQLAREKHPWLPQVDYAQQLLQQASEGMERIIDDLHPAIVEFGLVDALTWQCRHFSRQSGLDCKLQCEPGLQVSDEFVVLSLLRILREALNNAARHARARHIEVGLHAEGERLHLSVSDDGCGLDPQRALRGGRPGHGLTNMRLRAEALGGSLALAARPGGGTVVRVDVPVTH
ncbi:sensor histidine kinase [Herbaspirillum sp. DW155]|uniref:sensor histidine kinase n=1 Tax=Herbaspirillum sp. DW155 TaxID=3095609 RepID=UPI0030911785|nr:sensor histidine kinase [Herbaspirillum sp. DW155]